MTSLKGVEMSFDESLQIAPIAEIEGVKDPFLHINQLIQNKKSVARLKDQDDVEHLENIRRITENKQPGEAD
jgi:hypothetical protein